MERRLQDLLPTRREVLKWGGMALAGTCIDRVVWPLEVHGQDQSVPRGTARYCIMIEMGGAISQMDCWDFKETRWTPKDLDVRKVTSDLFLSNTLFPQLSEEAGEVAIVRSMRAPELVHFNGQYHTQTGRALDVGLGKEIPGFGTVLSAELEPERRESDTFPTYMSTSLMKSRCGAIGSGFFPARFTGLDLDPTTVFDSFGDSAAEGPNRVFEERWRLLRALAEVSPAERSLLGEKGGEYEAFFDEAHGLLDDPRWNSTFTATEEEKERYGDDAYGLGLILARNLISADAGTRFVYVYDGDLWDHHSYIFDHSKYPRNHYFTCNRFDKGFTSLLRDLRSMPGHEPGKTLLDETLVVATSEFGRTKEMNPVAGRDHHRLVYSSMLAGGGVKGGRIIGKTDEFGAECIDTGWKHPEQPEMNNLVATMYSALGVEWRKIISNTPSGRAYKYTQTAPVGGAEFISDDAIDELFE